MISLNYQSYWNNLKSQTVLLYSLFFQMITFNIFTLIGGDV